MKFREWVISEEKKFRDIYGMFDTNKRQPGFEGIEGVKQPEGEGPIFTIDSETIMDELKRLKLGLKRPVHEWHDKVEWHTVRNEPGSIYAEISPLGKTRITVRRLTRDIYGENIWITKRVVPFRQSMKNYEKELAYNVAESLEVIDKELLDTPQKEYKDFGKLVTALATNLRKYAPDVMMYQATKKISENNYLIYFEYRGQGVEAPTATRMEEFIVDVAFKDKLKGFGDSKGVGFIKVTGHGVSSPTRQHLWSVDPSDFVEWFAPTQPIDEIVKNVVAALSTY